MKWNSQNNSWTLASRKTSEMKPKSRFSFPVNCSLSTDELLLTSRARSWPNQTFSAGLLANRTWLISWTFDCLIFQTVHYAIPNRCRQQLTWLSSSAARNSSDICCRLAQSGSEIRPCRCASRYSWWLEVSRGELGARVLGCSSDRRSVLRGNSINFRRNWLSQGK